MPYRAILQSIGTRGTRSLHLNRAMSTASAAASSMFPVQASIMDKLTRTFHPSHLDVINESHMHNVPQDSETHFKVVVVTSQFDSIKSPIQRHRLIHGALEEELKGPVHALSIVAKSPSQWDTMLSAGQTIPASPACRGGDGSLPSKHA